jgi:hypothetical protein
MENPSPSSRKARICPSCRSPVEPGYKFCQVCGRKMDELPACKNCGAQFIAPVKFCEMCGTPVTRAEIFPRVDAGLPAPEPLVPEEPEEIEPDIPEPEPHLPQEQEQVEPDIPEHEVMGPDIIGMNVPEEDIMEPVPASRDMRRSSAPAEYTSLAGPDAAPAKKTVKFPLNMARIAGLIVILLIIIAGAYFVGLPMLKGGKAVSPAPAVPGPQGAEPPVATPMAEPIITPPAAPPATPPTLTMPTPDNSLKPQPTQQMPRNQEVYFNVDKDGYTKKITILFQRGGGENLIGSADVTVIHPDGSVLTGTLNPSHGITEITLDGSKGTDRVVVIANMYSGQSYRINDELKT